MQKEIIRPVCHPSSADCIFCMRNMLVFTSVTAWNTLNVKYSTLSKGCSCSSCVPMSWEQHILP